MNAAKVAAAAQRRVASVPAFSHRHTSRSMSSSISAARTRSSTPMRYRDARVGIRRPHRLKALARLARADYATAWGGRLEVRLGDPLVMTAPMAVGRRWGSLRRPVGEGSSEQVTGSRRNGAHNCRRWPCAGRAAEQLPFALRLCLGMGPLLATERAQDARNSRLLET